MSADPLTVAARYVEIGRPELALQTLAGLDGDTAAHPYALLLRGRALCEMERFDDAAQAARDGLPDAPADIALLYLLSVAEEGRGDLAAAEAAILAALAEESDDAVLLCQYARVLMHGGALDKAERVLDKADAASRAPSACSPTASRWPTCATTTRRPSASPRSCWRSIPRTRRRTACSARSPSTAATWTPRRSASAAPCARTRPTTGPPTPPARPAAMRSLFWLPSRFFARYGAIQTWIGAVVVALAPPPRPGMAGLAVAATHRLGRPLRLVLDRRRRRVTEGLVRATTSTACAPALDAGALPNDALVPAGQLALAQGDLHARRAAARRRPPRRRRRRHRRRWRPSSRSSCGGPPEPPGAEPESRASRSSHAPSAPPSTVTFADVGGLDEVKKPIHRTIILPFQRPDLYERYGRRAGGGVLLYGPPGCGKTLLARATAGECGVPFLNVRIEDVLDPYFGGSASSACTTRSRTRARRAPCVLFLDELDALAFARRKQQGGAGRALVDQLLQELDAIGSDNQGMLVLAATNAPWDVDDALKRPGRFDRVVFVPPPDAPARRAHPRAPARRPPVGGVDAPALADRDRRFSRRRPRRAGGARDGRGDRRRARARRRRADHAGRTSSARSRDARPTTLDWLRTARNYVEFANQGGRYDDVLAFLGRREVKAAVKGR